MKIFGAYALLNLNNNILIFLRINEDNSFKI